MASPTAWAFASPGAGADASPNARQGDRKADLILQAGEISADPSSLAFNLLPGYTQASTTRTFTLTNTTASTITDIRFENFTGVHGTDTEGRSQPVPYVVVDDDGVYPLTDNFIMWEQDGRIAWTDWARENGYTALAPGESRTYRLAVERSAYFPCMMLGTDITDTIDIASSAGTTTLSLRTCVYEPSGMTAVIGTKTDTYERDPVPASSITLPDLKAGEGMSPQARIVALQNTTTTIDPISGEVPSLVVQSVEIANDEAGVFGVVSQYSQNVSVGPLASVNAMVYADSTSVPAGTYTANLMFYVAPSTVSFNAGVTIGDVNAEGFREISIPVRVTITGDNPNLRPAPANFTAEAGNGLVALSWDAVPANSEGYDGYNIWRADWTADGAFEPMAYPYESVYGTETRFIDRNVSNGTTYTYYISSASGGTDANERMAAKAGPVLATPSSSAAAKPDAPWLDVNLDWGVDCVIATWRMQDFDSDGTAEGIDHFNVYLDGKLVKQVSRNTVISD